MLFFSFSFYLLCIKLQILDYLISIVTQLEEIVNSLENKINPDETRTELLTECFSSICNSIMNILNISQDLGKASTEMTLSKAPNPYVGPN